MDFDNDLRWVPLENDAAFLQSNLKLSLHCQKNIVSVYKIKFNRSNKFAFNKILFTPWRYANELNTEIVISYSVYKIFTNRMLPKEAKHRDETFLRKFILNC